MIRKSNNAGYWREAIFLRDMGTGQMLMGSGNDHSAPANGHFLAALELATAESDNLFEAGA
jgi:hypothetical protein